MANLSYIQSVTTGSVAGANGAASFTSATKGNLLVTMCFQSVPGGLGGTPTMSIADTPNGVSTNAWTKVWANVGTLGLGNGAWYQAWVCINKATGADTITVTPSVVTGRFTTLSIFEVSGFTTAFRLDQVGTATGPSLTKTIPEVDLTTLYPMEALFAMTQMGVGDTGNPTITGNYTFASSTGTGSWNDWCAYSLQASAGTYKYTGTSQNAAVNANNGSFAFSISQPGSPGSLALLGCGQ